jgi:hypothetical protein
MDAELHAQLQRIEHEIAGVRKAVVESWYGLLFRGLAHGAGFILGTVFAIAIAGWLLSMFGVIPGLRETISELRIILEAQSRI